MVCGDHVELVCISNKYERLLTLGYDENPHYHSGLDHMPPDQREHQPSTAISQPMPHRRGRARWVTPEADTSGPNSTAIAAQIQSPPLAPSVSQPPSLQGPEAVKQIDADEEAAPCRVMTPASAPEERTEEIQLSTTTHSDINSPSTSHDFSNIRVCIQSLRLSRSLCIELNPIASSCLRPLLSSCARVVVSLERNILSG